MFKKIMSLRYVKDAVENMKNIKDIPYAIFMEYDYLNSVQPKHDDKFNKLPYVKQYDKFMNSFVDSEAKLIEDMETFRTELLVLGYSVEVAEKIILYALCIKLRANTAG